MSLPQPPHPSAQVPNPNATTPYTTTHIENTRNIKGYENAFGSQPYVFGGGALALVNKPASICHRLPQIRHTLLCQEKPTKTLIFE
jgi:hypothetical protein